MNKIDKIEIHSLNSLLKSNRTKIIRISPFEGEGDIAPKSIHDHCAGVVSISNQNLILSFWNLKRVFEGFNPNNIKSFVQFAKEGYQDAEKYFKREGRSIEKRIKYNSQFGIFNILNIDLTNMIESSKKNTFPLVIESNNNFQERKIQPQFYKLCRFERIGNPH